MTERIHRGRADGGSRKGPASGASSPAATAAPRKRVAERRRGDDAYNRVLFETSPIGLALCRMDGSLVDVNPAFARILGRTVAETLSLTYWEITPRSYEDAEAAQLTSLEETGRYGPYEKEYIHEDGHLVPVRLQGSILPLHGERFIWSSVEDVTERVQTEQALLAAHRRLREVLESVSDAFVSLDKDWCYTYVNRKAGEIFGRRPEDLVGKHIWTEFPEGVGQPFHDAYYRAAREQVPIQIEEYYPPYDRWFENRIYPSEEGLSIFFHDITVRKRAEALLEDQRALLEMVARGVPLPDTLHALVTRIEARSPGMRGSVLLLDEDGRHVHHGAAPSLPEAYNRAIDGVAIGPRAGSCGTAAWRREQVIVTDLATDPLWDDYRDLALAHGLRACWSTPILSSAGGVLGTFAMYYTEPRAPTAEDLRLIESATGLAGIAIERRNAEAELRTANEELRTVNQVMTTITGVMDIKVILEEVLDQALRITGLEGGTICLLREDGALELAAERATSEATIKDLTTNLVKVGDCLCGSCARDCKPLILRSLAEVRGYATRESNRDEAIQFHAAFPLVTARVCEGVLCVFTRGREKPRERSLGLLETLSSQTALAIRNARLFRDVEAHAAALEERVRERTAQLETANAQTESALERATAADRAKSAFLAAMSHELRTPLNSVIGFTGGLLGGLVGGLTTEQREVLEIVQRNGRHLLDLINDVLDLSRIEAGEMRLAIGRFDLADLVRQGVESVGPQVTAKGLKISLELPAPELPFRGDARHVSQILLNLLSNAIKFTNRGEVTIRVRKVMEPKGIEDIEVDVMDTGMGMAEADMPRLFREFEQLDSGLDRRQNGTGLGLALSRRLARLMGGDVTAQSALGVGSTFTLRLPSEGST